jgi:hypothetical protein
LDVVIMVRSILFANYAHYGVEEPNFNFSSFLILETLMRYRHQSLQQKWSSAWGSVPFESLYPPQLNYIVKQWDPIHQVHEAASDSSVSRLPMLLMIGGERDRLVPFSCNTKFISLLQTLYAKHQVRDHFKCFVDPNAEHQCTDAMASEIVVWFQQWMKLSIS